jgi:hypothetical protein
MKMKITFTENNKQTSKTFTSVSEVQSRIILLKEFAKEPGFFQQDELASLKCWLYNRHKGPGRMDLTKEAFM